MNVLYKVVAGGSLVRNVFLPLRYSYSIRHSKLNSKQSTYGPWKFLEILFSTVLFVLSETSRRAHSTNNNPLLE